jgi:hypothetical protein
MGYSQVMVIIAILPPLHSSVKVASKLLSLYVFLLLLDLEVVPILPEMSTGLLPGSTPMKETLVRLMTQPDGKD